MLILQAHHFLEAVMKTNGRHGAPTEHLELLNDADGDHTWESVVL